MADSSPLELGRRERQIVEAVYRLGEASVVQVRAELADRPSYSAVRGMLNLLVGKKLLATRHQGKRYLYRPLARKETVRKSALKRLVHTFFGNDPVDAVVALLGGSAGKLSSDDLQRIRQMINDAESGKSTKAR